MGNPLFLGCKCIFGWGCSLVQKYWQTQFFLTFTICCVGGREGAEQTWDAGGSLSRIHENYEGSTTDHESAGHILPQCRTGTLQFQQKRA